MKIKITCIDKNGAMEKEISEKDTVDLSEGVYYITQNKGQKYKVKLIPMESNQKTNEKEADEIEKSILHDGYVKNKNLYRRWIMAQMLRHYKNEYNNTSNFDKWFVTGKSYKYAWDTTKNEVKALRHLTGKELKKRERFFNLNVVKEMATEYRKLVMTQNIGNFDAREVSLCVDAIWEAKNYFEMYKALNNFIKNCPMNIDCPKPTAWKNAFKGTGAYYTMDNLIKFHGCRWKTENGYLLTLEESLKELEKAVNNNRETYYKLYAIMCNFIEYNHFNFKKRMEEIYKTKKAAG